MRYEEQKTFCDAAEIAADIGRHYDSFCTAKPCLGGFIGTVIPESRVEIVYRKRCVFPVQARGKSFKE